MTKSLMAAVTLVLSMAPLFPGTWATAGSPAVATNDIHDFEQTFSTALQHNDVLAIDASTSDDWQIISGDGRVISKKRFLAVISTGDLKHESMSGDEETLRRFGDVALITRRTHSAGSYKGVAFRTDEIATDVVVKRKGRWFCVLTQLTTVVQQ
ncbi:MAG TPA: nuclear transport factor 2 family protein [Steroidobacteraceae bacterium]|jgi:ketosteroid isomerase-like protein